ncbi:MAG TPA: alpha/beta hydrolase [Nitrospira sp.]|nr:alpha/beta hydrolase [Nitrospira sp.]HMU29145.1 alpha/beta hydrolase [Nitrospira sp.]HMV55650.1 alpha/beta hydrolase [Nitrospira sp.]HMW85199.1 alpha/beta hydrolase [Nitrospira sp.]HMX90543.1 alpha/beta hydrolase [Nitrospira sp.]
MQRVSFKNRNIIMAGSLCQPRDFKDGARYPAVVVVHPAGGVKEQTAGEYAKRLAAEGFVTLAFDTSYQGESGGEPRYLDEPMNRVGDIYSAVDYLTTLPFVDAERIGILGICAGGGYSVKAASLDRRIKAVATASAANVGNAARKGWDGKSPMSALPGTLEMLVNQRTAEAAGAAIAYAPYVPNVGESSPFRDLREGSDYYLTPRGRHPNAPNKMLMTSLMGWIAFDAFDLVDPLLTQPLMICAGSEADSLWQSQELYAKAPGSSKELFIIERASHMGLYDGSGREAVLGKITPFFRANL